MAEQPVWDNSWPKEHQIEVLGKYQEFLRVYVAEFRKQAAGLGLTVSGHVKFRDMLDKWGTANALVIGTDAPRDIFTAYSQVAALSMDAWKELSRVNKKFTYTALGSAIPGFVNTAFAFAAPGSVAKTSGTRVQAILKRMAGAGGQVGSEEEGDDAAPASPPPAPIKAVPRVAAPGPAVPVLAAQEPLAYAGSVTSEVIDAEDLALYEDADTVIKNFRIYIDRLGLQTLQIQFEGMRADEQFPFALEKIMEWRRAPDYDEELDTQFPQELLDKILREVNHAQAEKPKPRSASVVAAATEGDASGGLGLTSAVKATWKFLAARASRVAGAVVPTRQIVAASAPRMFARLQRALMSAPAVTAAVPVASRPVYVPVVVASPYTLTEYEVRLGLLDEKTLPSSVRIAVEWTPTKSAKFPGWSEALWSRAFVMAEPTFNTEFSASGTRWTGASGLVTTT